MRAWGVLPTISAPMPFQMALDEILFRAFVQDPDAGGRLPAPVVERPLLRFYLSSEPWVSFGYSHPSADLEREKRNACKRITGGGRVEHGRDVIFSLLAVRGHEEAFKSVRVSYLKIHEAVKSALESFGLTPRFYRCDENLPKGRDCFLFPIATDLGLEGRKIAGGAQKRSRGALLHQESVKLPDGIGFEGLIQALGNAFELVFETKLERHKLDPAWLEEAETLALEKYGAPAGALTV